MLIPGSQLDDRQRQEVLAAFVHRLSEEHARDYALTTGTCLSCRQPWSACLGKCTTAWVTTDREWLDARAFYFTRARHGNPSHLAITRPCYTMAEYAALRPPTAHDVDDPRTHERGCKC